jgi:hypothetical protein
VCDLETSGVRRLKPASGYSKPVVEEEEEKGVELFCFTQELFYDGCTAPFFRVEEVLLR